MHRQAIDRPARHVEDAPHAAAANNGAICSRADEGQRLGRGQVFGIYPGRDVDRAVGRRLANRRANRLAGVGRAARNTRVGVAAGGIDIGDQDRRNGFIRADIVGRALRADNAVKVNPHAGVRARVNRGAARSQVVVIQRRVHKQRISAADRMTAGDHRRRRIEEQVVVRRDHHAGRHADTGGVAGDDGVGEVHPHRIGSRFAHKDRLCGSDRRAGNSGVHNRGNATAAAGVIQVQGSAIGGRAVGR